MGDVFECLSVDAMKILKYEGNLDGYEVVCNPVTAAKHLGLVMLPGISDAKIILLGREIDLHLDRQAPLWNVYIMKKPEPKKPEKPRFRAPDGSEHDDELDYLLGEHLGICGCGRPEMAAEFVRELLEAHDTGEGSMFHKESMERRTKIFQTMGEPASWFTMYMLDHLGLTEHGGSVEYAWLTDHGRMMMVALKRALEQRMSDERASVEPNKKEE